MARAADVQVLYSIGVSLDGVPGPLIRAQDGSFYGVFQAGGRLGRGSIFRLNADATARTNVFDFAEASTNLSVNAGAIVAVTNGFIYGAFTDFPAGGTNLVYRVGTNGDDFTVLHGLPDPFSSVTLASDGRFYVLSSSRLDRFEIDGRGYVTVTNGLDVAGVMEGEDGLFYGVANGQTIRRLGKDASGETTLTNVTPRGIVSLIIGKDGRLYGTEDNFPNGQIAFGVNADGTGLATLGSIDAGGQDSAITSLLDGEDGKLYATLRLGPVSSSVRIVSIDKAGGVATVTNLPASFGNNSGSHVITLGADGRLYGSASTGGTNAAGVIYTLARDGTGLTGRFQFGTIPGSFIESAPTLGKDGRLYGTARQGGFSNRGMVFRLERSGSRFTVLKEFISTSDGVGPRGGLIEDGAGALYGTTESGGANGGGTVFRINSDGTGFLALTNFSAAMGTNPIAQLLLARDGALYGSCFNGGTSTNGTLWKLQTDGTGFTVLKTFPANGSQGRRPLAPLIEGSDGALYGVTDAGGSSNKGVIFAIAKDGSGYQVLRSLQGFGDAANPEGRLLQLPDGTLIGTSTAGGSAGLGSIFRIQTNGAGYRVVHSFVSTNSDARVPVGGLVSAGDGSLLGTTRFGGGEAVGTIFKINPDGTAYEIVYRFSSTYPSPQEPWAPLTPGLGGEFFGATTLGGLSFSGAIFRIDLGTALPPSLTVQSAGGGYEISWAASASGYQLQMNLDLSNPTGWQVVTGASNGTYTLPIASSNSAAFYRLIKP